MAIRIIQINQPDGFWEQLATDGFFKQSQMRSGIAVNLKEGDAVFVFKNEEDATGGEIICKCSVTRIGESIDDGEEIYATLELVEMYEKGTCTYSDLLSEGFIKQRRFHWNILPLLDDYISGKNKGAVPEKEAPAPAMETKTIKETRKDRIIKKTAGKEEKMKKDDKKKVVKTVKKAAEKKDEKKKVVKQAAEKKDDKKKVVKKAAEKKDGKKKVVKKAAEKKDDKKKVVKKAPEKKDDKKKRNKK